MKNSINNFKSRLFAKHVYDAAQDYLEAIEKFTVYTKHDLSATSMAEMYKTQIMINFMEAYEDLSPEKLEDAQNCSNDLVNEFKQYAIKVWNSER